jgi:hypothetical protein
MTASGTTISEMPFLLQDSNDESVLLSKVAGRTLRIAVLELGPGDTLFVPQNRMSKKYMPSSSMGMYLNSMPY